MSAANHVRVSQAGPLLRQSFHVTCAQAQCTILLHAQGDCNSRTAVHAGLLRWWQGYDGTDLCFVETWQRCFDIHRDRRQRNRTHESLFTCLLPQYDSGGALTTLVMRRMARPSRAAATALTPSWPPKIHSATVRPRPPAVIFSLRDSGPSFCSSSLRTSPATAPSEIHPTPCSPAA